MTDKNPGGRPPKYPAHFTAQQKTEARTREREAAGWYRRSLWLAPGTDYEEIRRYVDRKNNAAIRAAKKKVKS